VPVTVIDIDHIVRGEFAENAFRRDFLPSEVDAIRRALEPLERAAARKRISMAARVRKFRNLPGPSIVSGLSPGFPVVAWRKSEPLWTQPIGRA